MRTLALLVGLAGLAVGQGNVFRRDPAARMPEKGPLYQNNRAARINASGQLEAVQGTASHCVLVDGTSQACGAGALQWGLIGGTLSAQTDLANALAAKAGIAACGANQVAIATLVGGISCVSLTTAYLPVGTSAGTVAAGDHGHTGVYAPVASPTLADAVTVSGTAPLISLVSTHGTDRVAYGEIRWGGSRQWAAGSGFPSSTNENWSVARYADGVYASVPLAVDRATDQVQVLGLKIGTLGGVLKGTAGAVSAGEVGFSEIASAAKQGAGTRLVTSAASPADGCATWASGTLGSTGLVCGSGGGGAVWGGITGTIGDQTDLANLVAARLAAASNLSDLANAATARTNLGLGDVATRNMGTTAGTVAHGDHLHGGVYAALAHTHAIADVTGLQTALDAKASTSHNHDATYQPLDGDLTAIAALTCSDGQLAKRSGAAWTCQDDATGGSGSGAPNYSQSFAGQTTVYLTHNLGTKNLVVTCYDDMDVWIQPSAVAINASAPYIVNVIFTQAQTGRCIVNGTGGSTASRYAHQFAAGTQVTVTGATHALGTPDIDVTCRDNNGQMIEPDRWVVDFNSHDVTIYFHASQSGRCVLM